MTNRRLSPRMTPAEIANARFKRRDGQRLPEIAAALGRSQGAIHRYIYDLEVTVILRCAWCGEQFIHVLNRGPQPLYCPGQPCRSFAKAKRRNARRRLQKESE